MSVLMSAQMLYSVSDPMSGSRSQWCIKVSIVFYVTTYMVNNHTEQSEHVQITHCCVTMHGLTMKERVFFNLPHVEFDPILLVVMFIGYTSNCAHTPLFGHTQSLDIPVISVF